MVCSASARLQRLGLWLKCVTLLWVAHILFLLSYMLLLFLACHGLHSAFGEDGGKLIIFDICILDEDIDVEI